MHHKSATDLGTRRDRLIHELVHDSYKNRHKLMDPTVCPGCGAVYHRGRWQWITQPPKEAERTQCQACQRTADQYPAGIITLTGSYVGPHKEELKQMVRNREREENQSHPLHRIMSIEEHSNALIIKTTDIHLPHRITESLRDAYQGDLKIEYGKEEYFVRADWQRDEIKS